MWNIPNSLTLLRIAFIPMFVGVFYLPADWLAHEHLNMFATGLFGLAAITDWLDGYLARVLRQTSAFGAFLDPVADKLMVAAALVMLVELGRVSALIAFIIIGREIAISALREWMASIGQRGSVAVAMIGKVKTAMQMVAIFILLYQAPVFGFQIRPLGDLLMWLAALLTLISMAYYLKAAWPLMRLQK